MNKANSISFVCYGITGEIYPDGTFTWGPGRAKTLGEASPFLREAVESASGRHGTMNAKQAREASALGLEHSRAAELKSVLYGVRVAADSGCWWALDRVRHTQHVLHNLRTLGYRVTHLRFGYILVRW